MFTIKHCKQKSLQGRSFSLTLVIAKLSASFLSLASEDCSKPLREKQQEGWMQYTLWTWLLGHQLDNMELDKLSACLFWACTKPRKDWVFGAAKCIMTRYYRFGNAWTVECPDSEGFPVLKGRQVLLPGNRAFRQKEIKRQGISKGISRSAFVSGNISPRDFCVCQ